MSFHQKLLKIGMGMRDEPRNQGLESEDDQSDEKRGIDRMRSVAERTGVSEDYAEDRERHGEA
jgi:hypothetical protein